MGVLGAIVTLALCIAVFTSSRRWAGIAILLGVCYVPQSQYISLGFSFTSIRLVLLAGFIRVLIRGELRGITFNKIDKTILIYSIAEVIVPTIRTGSVGEFIFQTGQLYNLALSYFAFRSLIRDRDDFEELLRAFVPFLIPFALLMIVESGSGRSPFSIFGGVAEYSMVRDGHVRSQAAFRSPITAGAFGATFAMFFASLYFSHSNRRQTLIGLAASLVILICGRSSGPILGLMVGMLSLACWIFRSRTRQIRWGILLTLIGLNMVMKAPVWFLLGRISDIVGGGGYHRAYLIDQFVNRFSSWWLVGTTDTSDWMATQLESGGADLTNQFVADGINAGLIGLILAIMVLTRCFQAVGSARRAIHETDPDLEKLVWGLGSALVGSIGILFSVTYFDQMHVIWYFLLASLASVATSASKNLSNPDDPEIEMKPISITSV